MSQTTNCQTGGVLPGFRILMVIPILGVDIQSIHLPFQTSSSIAMLTKLSLRNRLVSCMVAGGFCLASASNTMAGDCGCEPTCAICPTAEICECDCSCKKKPNLVYKALDSVAGGIEKLFGLDKCGTNACDMMEVPCDDGCDTIMMHEMPSSEVIYDEPHHGHSHHGHAHSVPLPPMDIPSPPIRQSAPVYTGPMEEMRIKPTGPSQWHQPSSELRMSEPRMVQPHSVAPRSTQPRSTQRHAVEAGQHLGETPLADPEVGEIQQPLLTPEPEPRSDSPAPEVNKEESLFDTLSNPFGDDARARLPRPVRPSNYEEIELKPISKRPLSRSYSESNRRVRSVR
jgi:hypothetical protein